MDYSKFTSQWKDDALKLMLSLCTPYALCHLDAKSICNDFDLLNVFVHQLKERGFIADGSVNSYECSVILTSTAIDFVACGGFTVEEQVIESGIQKAIFELEKLQAEPGLKDYVEKITGVTSILSNSVTAFSTLFGSAK